MAYIFLDESGDLGFDFKKHGTTKHFLITILFTSQKRPIEKVVKRIYSRIREKHDRRADYFTPIRKNQLPANGCYVY